MEILYWIFEYAKVLFCYGFVMFVWPSVVFRKYLHEKSKIFRFCFCATVPIVLYSTVILLLGLVHLLNAWIVNILFYGMFLFGLRDIILPNDEQKQEIRRLVSGTLRLRYFMSRRISDIWTGFLNLCKKLWKAVRPRLLEYSLLFVLIAFGVLYFSYAPLKDHSYGYGDLYTHHSWIYGLIQGQSFSAGIYPEAMHCILYLLHTISGITVYSCNLYLGAIHSAFILLSAYCLMREIFRSRYTPILVLAAYVIIATRGTDSVISIARMQRTLPLEYGLHTQYLCALFLLKFLKEDLEKGWQKKWGWLRNENLLLFSMSLAASITIHFHVTIMAFFLCVPFAIVFIKRIFTNARFLPLVMSAVCGVVIAFAPMGVALATGIPFQGSIAWALSIMNPEETDADIEDTQIDNEQQDQTDIEDITDGSLDEGQEEVVVEYSFTERLEMIWNTVKSKIRDIYSHGYKRTFFGDKAGSLMAALSVLLVALWLIYRLLLKLISLIFHAKMPADIFDNYIPMILALFVFIVLYTALFLGIPQFVEYLRLPSTTHMLFLIVAAMPIDIILGVFQLFCPKLLMEAVSVACAVAIYVVSVATGNLHGYFYNELTRYNSAVDVTASITRSFPKNSYTVISSTDDLYSIIEYGRHEELIDFLSQVERGERYYIPTEYIFIYVEKKPIVHAQTHFISGPSWLASDAYCDNYFWPGSVSKSPEILSTQISDEYARYDILYFSAAYQSYKNAISRTILNAKAMKWCEEFSRIYSHEMKIYYENDEFICYYFKQNPYSLYDLAIDY